MSTAVEGSHHGHFSFMLDTMARPPGTGWGHEPFASFQSRPENSHHSKHQQDGRLPGPSSLFSSHHPSASTSPSSLATSSHNPYQQHTASPPVPSPHYSNRRQSYFSDYATPSPVSQTTPLGDQPLQDHHHHHHQQPRRSLDPRLSPARSIASERSDEPEGHRGHAAHHNGHPAFSFPPHPAMYQPVVRQPQQGGMMGKLVPPSYSANGRQPRSTSSAVSPVQRMQQSSSPPPPPPRHQIQHQMTMMMPGQRLERPVPQPPGVRPFCPTPQQTSSSLPLANGHASYDDHQKRQMSIHTLISDSNNRISSSSRSSSSTPTQIPPPTPTAPTTLPSSSSSSTKCALTVPTPGYRLVIRQQPAAARSCGFGERDRRVIDPPPIVQLITLDPSSGRPTTSPAPRETTFAVVHCTIWNEAGDADASCMADDLSRHHHQKRLTGQPVSSPFGGRDDIGEDGVFFCFPDLSCRTPGSFRLKFSLVVLDPSYMRIGMVAPVVATAMSDVFTVYNAKDFPGMQASTPLTRTLKAQGCTISIKKGSDKERGGGEDDVDDSEDEMDSPDGPEGKRKKARRS